MAKLRSDAQQNRDHLIAVAKTLVKDGEVPAFNALARAAQVGVGTVYRHFADEAELMSALAAVPMTGFTGMLDAAVTNDDAGAALDTVFRQSVKMVMQQPMVARLLARSPRAARELEGKLESVVARAKKANALRSEVTVSDLRRLVCGVELAAASGADADAAAERYVEIVLQGLKPSMASKRKTPRRVSSARRKV